ncbi:MAG: gamma-glutamyltransferase family protein [Gammaproteobacteria bacterium]|nr:gamma-glutamyltransferase family protein [Gammaproteobacteria bacterium]
MTDARDVLAFRSRRPTVYATRGLVATSQPLAALAGLDILKAGGNAADAAIAGAAMLAVVEPMMTGPGGDCFALYYDARSRTVSALNGSGRAPAAASLESLRQRGVTRMPEYDGRAVSVPGAVAGWDDLITRHGTLTLADVLAPAIWTAEHGFPVTEVVAALWTGAVSKLLRAPDWTDGGDSAGPEQPSGAELLCTGRAPRAGEVVRLPALAGTLRAIAADGREWFYRGEFAHKAAAHVRRYGGWLAPDDMAEHESTWDVPIHTRYGAVELYECPPNGQGLATLLALGLARGFDLEALPAPDRTHLMIECMRLAFADAARWVADPHVVGLPLDALLTDAYAERRRRLIDPRHAAPAALPGDPRDNSDTVYLSVVDAEGNACSFINSLYRAFGTGLVVPGTGVALHNRAAGFALDPGHPNALAPGKRPYQTIIPALTLHALGPDAGALHACFGVVGGQQQPQGQFQILVNLLTLGLPPQAALDAPRWQLAAIPAGAGMQPTGAAEAGGRVLIEDGWDPALLAELERRGHRLQSVGGYDRASFGGAQLIIRDPATGVLAGASDPRLDGCAVGW